MHLLTKIASKYKYLRLKNDYILGSLFALLLCIVVFWPTIIKQKLPLATDILTGYNLPWINTTIKGQPFPFPVKNKENFRLLAGDLNNLPFKANSVGLIIAADILEHLDDDRNGIVESYRVLTKGGILIITVPAFNFLWGIQDVVTGHKRRYSKKEIKNKLRAAGFDVLKSSYFNFFLFFPILIGRRIIQFLGLKIRSENEVNFPLLNFMLKAVFSLEPILLKYFSFPFGVSIFCVAQK